LTILPDSNYEVRALIEGHNYRVLHNDYNPDSGLLPVTNLGDKLSTFVAQQRGASYTGTVRILKAVPDIFTARQLCHKLSINDESHPAYPTGFVIGDLSGSITVLVSGEARSRILEVLLPPPSIDDDDSAFAAASGRAATSTSASSTLLLQPSSDLFGAIQHCRVTIHSVYMNDERYFVMSDLEAI
jgi:hypothetical protein